jgi:hypothetical protein
VRAPPKTNVHLYADRTEKFQKHNRRTPGMNGWWHGGGGEKGRHWVAGTFGLLTVWLTGGIVRPKPFGRSHSTNRCVFYWWSRLFLKTHFFFIRFYIVGRILVGNPLSLQVKFRSKMNKTKRIICSSCCRRWIQYINYKPTVIWQYLEYYVYIFIYAIYMITHILYVQYILYSI